MIMARKKVESQYSKLIISLHLQQRTNSSFVNLGSLNIGSLALALQ